MEPILSKEEIADLLKSLQGGAAAGPVRSSVSPSAAPPVHREISLFDVTVASEAYAPIENVDIVITRFTTSFGSCLSRSLQRGVSIAPMGCRPTSLREYLLIEATGRAAFIIELAPLMVPAIVTLDGALCSALLEFALGGAGRPSAVSPDQPQSRLGLQILSTLLQHACEALEAAFKPICAISCSLKRVANDAELGSLIDPAGPVALYACSVEIESLAGGMDLIFPIRTLEPFRDALSKLTMLNDSGRTRWSSAISDDLASLSVNLVARSAIVEISIRNLLDLKPGDIIPINREPGADLDLLVEGVPKFSGILMHEHSRRKVRVTEPFQTG